MSSISPKGKAIVLQSGGCTPVINESLAGVVNAACRSRSITHIWGSLNGIRGIIQENLIDLKTQKDRVLKHICHLPSAALGSNRYQLREMEEYRVLERLEKWQVRYLFMIGGNDTAETGLRIAKAAAKRHYELRLIHVPKTIDNDLPETDHCPGYGSVARFAAIVTQEIGLDTVAMRHVDPVKIVEFMGRNSGWIVAASALLKKEESDPPHILLYPETAFDQNRFLKDVDHALTKYGYCVTAISETIRDSGGARVGARKEGILKDSFGHPYVEGAAHRLASLVENKLKVRARFDKPGTIQRMSMSYYSSVDHEEAFRCGEEAVKLALRGVTKAMVSFVRKKSGKYSVSFRPVPLEKIAGKERYLPASYRSPHGASRDFQKYALPLIGGNLPNFFKLKNISPKI